MNILLSPLIQFRSNSATNLHHLTSGVRRVDPQHGDPNVTTDYCNVAYAITTVTSLCPMYTNLFNGGQVNVFSLMLLSCLT